MENPIKNVCGGTILPKPYKIQAFICFSLMEKADPWGAGGGVGEPRGSKLEFEHLGKNNFEFIFKTALGYKSGGRVLMEN
jgi:hypothetical protein